MSLDIVLCQKVRTCSEINGDISKRQELKRTLAGQTWDNMSIQMNNDSNEYNIEQGKDLWVYINANK